MLQCSSFTSSSTSSPRFHTRSAATNEVFAHLEIMYMIDHVELHLLDMYTVEHLGPVVGQALVNMSDLLE